MLVKGEREHRRRSSVYKTQSATPGLRDEDEAEAEVCDTREWKEIGVVEQNERGGSSHKRR